MKSEPETFHNETQLKKQIKCFRSTIRNVEIKGLSLKYRNLKCKLIVY